MGQRPIAIVQVRVGDSPVAGQVAVPGASSPGLLDDTLVTNSGAWPVFVTVRFL